MWAHLNWFESDKLNSGMWVWVVSVFGYTHATWQCVELDCYEKQTDTVIQHTATHMKSKQTPIFCLAQSMS